MKHRAEKYVGLDHIAKVSWSICRNPQILSTLCILDCADLTLQHAFLYPLFFLGESPLLQNKVHSILIELLIPCALLCHHRVRVWPGLPSHNNTLTLVLLTMAPHSSTLAGKSHGQRSLVGCSPWGPKQSDTTEQLHFHFSLSWIGEGNGNPLLCSCLENPRDGGAWWAAVYGVAQSRTWLSRSDLAVAVLLTQQSPVFWALGPRFLEDNFTMDGSGMRCGLGMIRAHYIYCVLYFYNDYYISSTSDHQALGPGGWGSLYLLT